MQALRGEKRAALAALGEAEKAGWRGPYWRYYRDVDPSVASIRNEPEFRPCSPASSATWHVSAPISPPARRKHRSI